MPKETHAFLRAIGVMSGHKGNMHRVTNEHQVAKYK